MSEAFADFSYLQAVLVPEPCKYRGFTVMRTMWVVMTTLNNKITIACFLFDKHQQINPGFCFFIKTRLNITKSPSSVFIFEYALHFSHISRPKFVKLSTIWFKFDLSTVLWLFYIFFSSMSIIPSRYKRYGLVA